MPGYRKRFGSARGIGSHSALGRGSIRGGLGMSNFRITRSGVRPPRVRMGLPQVGVPRIHLGPGVIIHPRMHFATFDRSIIHSNWNAINRTPLQRAANLVRIIARRSIKRRKSRIASTPGTPPFSHWPGKLPPFKQIFNFPFKLGSSQIIGMTGFNLFAMEMPVPGLHEHGGYARRRIINRARYSGSWKGKFNTAQPRSSKGQFDLYQQPKFIKKRVRYPKRPFMMPALMKARKMIPKFWANSFRRKAYLGRSARRP